MLKRRDSVAISSVGNYLQTSSEDLKLAKTKLKKDIDDILRSYQGIDADIIVARLQEAADKIDAITNRFDYYAKYMKAVAKHDRENIDNAKKQISATTNQPVETMETNTIIDNVFVSGIEDGGVLNV